MKQVESAFYNFCLALINDEKTAGVPKMGGRKV